MHTLKIRTDGKIITALKQSLLFISLMFVIFPAIANVNGSGLTVTPAIRRILHC